MKGLFRQAQVVRLCRDPQQERRDEEAAGRFVERFQYRNEPRGAAIRSEGDNYATRR